MAAITHPHIQFHRQTLPKHGQIQVIFGPMFSGKTTELIRRVKRYDFANYNCLLVKYANDLRYDDLCVATHDRQVAMAVSCTELKTVSTEGYDVIGIDEGQFFPDVVQFSEKMANEGKTVIVAALDGTFQRKGFGSILDLVPIAESVIKLSAVCMNCFGEGSFTKRFGSETEVEVIGGADKYMAACRLCHLKKIDKIEEPSKKSKNDKENLIHQKKKTESNSNTGKITLKHKLSPITCLQSIENTEPSQHKKIKLAF